MGRYNRSDGGYMKVNKLTHKMIDGRECLVYDVQYFRADGGADGGGTWVRCP